MDENICEQCGTRNEPGAQFCVECQSFLPWYDTQEADLHGPGSLPWPTVPADRPDRPRRIRRSPRSVPPSGLTSAGGTVRRQPVADPPPRQPPLAPAIGRRVRYRPRRAAAAGGRAGRRRTDDHRGGARRRRGQRRGADLQPVADRGRVPGDRTARPGLVDDLVIGGPAAAQQQRAQPDSPCRSPAGRWFRPGISRLLLRVQSVAHPEVIVDEDLELTRPGHRRRRWCCGWNRASSGSRTTRPAGCRRPSTTPTATNRAG